MAEPKLTKKRLQETLLRREGSPDFALMTDPFVEIVACMHHDRDPENIVKTMNEIFDTLHEGSLRISGNRGRNVLMTVSDTRLHILDFFQTITKYLEVEE